jgi:hypothetical protein
LACKLSIEELSVIHLPPGNAAKKPLQSGVMWVRAVFDTTHCCTRWL